jgi:chorismate mutase
MEVVKAPLARWADGEGKLLVLAGPALAENAQQLDATARRLAAVRVDYLAAAVWPAAGAESDAGADARALRWLRASAAAHGLGAATEVATLDQLEATLAIGVDLLVVAGEAVADAAISKAMAHALRGAALPVLVANPAHPELEPWLEAIERFAAAGVGAVGAVHAGFPAVGVVGSREALGWELVIELRRRMPELTIVAAANRLAGRRDRLAEVAQAALDLGMGGVLLEAHPDPDHAWAAAERQVTPERAAAIVAALVVRRQASDASDLLVELALLRGEIDRVDRELVDLLARRMAVVDRIAAAKRERNAAPLQLDRWRSMVDERLRWAAALGVTPELAKEVFGAVHAESVRRQSARLRRPPGAGGERPDEGEA